MSLQDEHKQDKDRYAGLSKEELIHQLTIRATKEAADRGILIEIGWKAFRILVIPEHAPESQLKEMRKAFFIGAEYLFSSMITMMDSDKEPTEADLHKVSLIQKELNTFIAEVKKEFKP